MAANLPFYPFTRQIIQSEFSPIELDWFDIFQVVEFPEISHFVI